MSAQAAPQTGSQAAAGPVSGAELRQARRATARAFLDARLAEWAVGDYQVAVRERDPPQGMITNNLFPFITRWSKPTQTQPIPEHYAHIAVFVEVAPGDKWSLTAKGALADLVAATQHRTCSFCFRLHSARTPCDVLRTVELAELEFSHDMMCRAAKGLIERSIAEKEAVVRQGLARVQEQHEATRLGYDAGQLAGLSEADAALAKSAAACQAAYTAPSTAPKGKGPAAPARPGPPPRR